MSFTNYLHKLVFPLIILLLAYLPLAGQTPYVFRHLKVENGLSNNNVKTILKDCEGFLWIGTANGLNRYDGYSFKVYQPKEKDIHSLLSNDIWNLQEDGLGNLWIGSEARYCIYDRDKDNFITDIPSYLLKIGIQIMVPTKYMLIKDTIYGYCKAKMLFTSIFLIKPLKHSK